MMMGGGAASGKMMSQHHHGGGYGGAGGSGDTGSPGLFNIRPKQRKRRAKTFPVKLMEALLTNYDEQYIAWLPDGKSFVIISPEEFVDKVLGNAFKNSKYASFVRKLNRWGFARLTSGTGTDCFYHPLFQRDRMDLAAQMLCMPRHDSVSAKKRIELGIAATPGPVLTAADVDPQDRPSLAGVERFFADTTAKQAKEQTRKDKEKQAADNNKDDNGDGSSGGEGASSNDGGDDGDDNSDAAGERGNDSPRGKDEEMAETKSSSSQSAAADETSSIKEGKGVNPLAGEV